MKINENQWNFNARPKFINKPMIFKHSATTLIMLKPLFYCSKTGFPEDWAIRKLDEIQWNFMQKTYSKMWCEKQWQIMKNSSKKGAQIEQKSIQKRGPKIDAKMIPKRRQPPTPTRPLEGTLLRREHAEKQPTNKITTMIAESWRVQKGEVQCKMECERWGALRKRAQSTSRTPTRLGRLRHGADYWSGEERGGACHGGMAYRVM